MKLFPKRKKDWEDKSDKNLKHKLFNFVLLNTLKLNV